MATSQEIAQQIADQNSWFLQQHALASQIGQDPMAFRQGGGYFGGGVPVMPQHPGMIGSPGAFSYNQGPTGAYSFGNAMGRFGAAALGAAPIAATGMWEAGMAAAGVSSPLTNPFAAYGMARAAGFGIGGSIGLAGLAMAPATYAGFAMNNIVTGSRQQAMVNTALSPYNFVNTQAMSGQGFSRQDALTISSKIRQLGQIPELLTSFDEITRLLPMMKQSGVMNGVRDATEFSARMKETISTLRDVSKVLGSTMEEAGEFFVHSRRVGFLGRQAQLQNVMNAQVTMSATGMNRQQEMAMSETAAAFGTAIGGNRRLSVVAAQRLASNIGLATRSDPRLLETITNMTGKEDPGAAAADASVQLMNRGINVMGTGPGRYLLAGLSKFNEDGTVDIDEDRLRDFMLTGDRGALGRRASGVLASRKNVIAFERNQTKLAQKAIAAGGLEGFAKMMQGALGTDTDAALLVMQNQFGFTEEQTDLLKGLLDKGTAGLEQEKLDIAQMTARNASRMERSPGALWARMKTKMRNTFVEGLRQEGAEVHSKIGRYFDEMFQDFFDDAVIQVSEKSRKEFVRAFETGDMSQFGGAVDMAAYGRISGDSSFTKWLANSSMGGFALTGGSRSSGLTAEAARRDMSYRLFDTSGATQQQINEVVKRMDAGELAPVRAPGLTLEGLSADERAYAKYLGDTRRELMMDDEFAFSPADRQRQILEDRVAKRLMIGTSAFDTPAEAAARRGREALTNRGVDSFTAAAAASDRLVENARNQIGREGGQVFEFSPQELTEKRRAVNSGFRTLYGERMGDEIQKDPALQAALISTQGLDATQKSNLIAAARGGKDADAALADLNKYLTSKGAAPITKAQAAKIIEAKQGEAAEKDKMKKAYNTGGLTLEGLAADNATLNRAENRTWAKTAAEQTAEGIDISKVDARIKDEMAAVKTELEHFANTGKDQALDVTKVRERFSAVIEKIEGIKDEKERGKVLKTAGAGVSAAYARHKEAETELSRAGKPGSKTSVAQLAEKLGIEESTALGILKAEGYGSGDQKITKPISPEAAHALQQAATSRTLGTGLAAGAGDMNAKNKDSAQLVFFKTMTEALVSIAQRFGKDYTGPSDPKALKNANATVMAGAGAGVK